MENVDCFRIGDPFYEAVRVVLAHRGEQFYPDYVQGIAGASFLMSEPPPSAPVYRGGRSTADLLRLFGYEVEELGFEGMPLDQIRRAVPGFVARIREELSQGRPVIVWHAFSDGGFDVVCGYEEASAEFLGYGSTCGDESGPARAPEDRFAACFGRSPVFGAILVGEKTGEFSARQAEIASLCEAVRIAHSVPDRFLEDADCVPPLRSRRGFACYDAWIRRFTLGPKPPELDLGACRHLFAMYGMARQTAGPFLRRLAFKFPVAGKDLREAATCFEGEAVFLSRLAEEVFAAGSAGRESPESSREAGRLFSAAAKTYSVAIDHLEEALIKIAPKRLEWARSPARFEVDAYGLRLAAVKPWHWEQKCNPFMAALSEALAVTPHPYTYNDLMGLSGLAFQIRWEVGGNPPSWGPFCSMDEIPEELAMLSHLTGWELLSRWGGRAEGDDCLRRRLVAELDRGRVLIGHMDNGRIGVLCGYRNAGRILLWSTCEGRGSPVEVPFERIGEMCRILGRHTVPPSLGDCLYTVLRDAVRNWHRGRDHGGLPGREFCYGEAAYEAWLDDLRSGLTPANGTTRKKLEWRDPWNYVCLHDARRAAVIFLREWAAAAPEASREAIHRAGELYGGVVKTLARLVEVKRREMVASAAGTPLDRAREIQTVSEARILESQAIRAVEQALAALSHAVPAEPNA